MKTWGLAEAPPWPPLYRIVADLARHDGETFYLVWYRRFKGGGTSDSVLKVYL